MCLGQPVVLALFPGGMNGEHTQATAIGVVIYHPTLLDILFRTQNRMSAVANARLTVLMDTERRTGPRDKSAFAAMAAAAPKRTMEKTKL